MIEQLIEELERLNRIGRRSFSSVTQEDREWFYSHPLRRHTQHPMGWSEAIPAVVAWLKEVTDE
jgi:hypothetical protein